MNFREFGVQMKRRFIQNYLLIAVSFFVLTFPAYLLFSSFSEMNLFPSDLNFENPDQDYQFNDQEHESGASLLGTFIVKFLEEISLFDRSYHPLSPAPTLDQKACILRC